MFFSPFSTAITSLGEERLNLSAFRTFDRFVLDWICRFPLPLGIWEGLRFVIVALSGLFLTFFVLPCVILFMCIISPFSIAIISLGEDRASLGTFLTFVRFALVSFCLFPLPFGVWEGLRLVSVALPGLFSYHCFHI